MTTENHHDEICQVVGDKLADICERLQLEGSCTKTTSPDGQELSTCFEVRDRFGHSHIQIEINDKADTATCEYVYHGDVKSARFHNLKRPEAEALNRILHVIDQVTLFKTE